MKNETLVIGTIHHGGPFHAAVVAALDALETVDVEAFETLRTEYADVLADDDGYSEGWSDLYDAIEASLQDFLPAYCYFGSHEGDGSDVGVWIAWECVEDAIHDGELVSTDERIDGVECVVISDHGNATLYSADGKEVWGIV